MNSLVFAAGGDAQAAVEAMAAAEPGLQTGAQGGGGWHAAIIGDGALRIDERGALWAIAGRLHRRAMRANLPPGSDLEWVQHVLERFGDELGARQLVGEFVVLRRCTNGEVTVFRDAVGHRPAYVKASASILRIAGEPSSLLAAADVSRRPNLTALAGLVAFGYEERDETLWGEVTPLRAGHIAHWGQGPLDQRPYWAIDALAAPEGDPADRAQALGTTFRRAIQDRIEAGPRLGVMLSGGLDSSTVAGHAAALARPRLFQAQFPGLECDERVFGEAVARRWQVPLVGDDPTATVAALPLRPLAPDVPFDPQMGIATSLLNCAEGEADLMLTGEGGDCFMCASSESWRDDLAEGRLAKLWDETELRDAPWRRSRWRRLFRRLRPTPPPSVDGSVLRPGWVKRLASRGRPIAVHGRSHSHAQIASAWNRYGHPEALLRLRRLANRRGMELSHPWLDQRVVELLATIPQGERDVLHRDKEKPIARRAMERVVADAVNVREDSASHTVFLTRALFPGRSQEIRNLFRTPRLLETGLIRPNVVRWISECADGQIDPAPHLFLVMRLLAAETWLRHV